MTHGTVSDCRQTEQTAGSRWRGDYVRLSLWLVMLLLLLRGYELGMVTWRYGLAPDFPVLLFKALGYDLADVERWSGRLREAMQVLERGLEQLPDEPALLLQQAEILNQLEQPQAALQTVNRLLRGSRKREGA